MFTLFKRLTWKASLLATVLSLLAFTVAVAASGNLDTTFSGDGKVITDLNAGSIDSVGGLLFSRMERLLW
jgi:hypothetical protein